MIYLHNEGKGGSPVKSFIVNDGSIDEILKSLKVSKYYLCHKGDRIPATLDDVLLFSKFVRSGYQKTILNYKK